MYFDDHSPPHFHAFYAEYEATIGIESIVVLKGELPPRAYGLTIEWAQKYQNEFRKASSEFHVSGCHTSIIKKDLNCGRLSGEKERYDVLQKTLIDLNTNDADFQDLLISNIHKNAGCKYTVTLDKKAGLHPDLRCSIW